jgi:YbbR domain-containing protein
MKKNIFIIIVSLIFSILLWVSLSLSNEYYSTINVYLKIIDLPDGYTTASNLPAKIAIKMKGKGWKLAVERIGSISDFIISAKYDSGRIVTNLYNSLSDNRWITNEMEVININPDTISFKVEKILSKKMKILSSIQLNFKAGYGLAEPIYIYPESTLVYGPWSVLKNMTSVSTEVVSFNKLDSRINSQISLINKQGLSFDITSASVYLNVQKIVGMDFYDLPITINDVPKDREVVILPNKLSIGVRGGIDILGKISSDQFKISINYRNIVLDTLGSVQPNIELPQNVTLIYSKPERLRYIIKKY